MAKPMRTVPKVGDAVWVIDRDPETLAVHGVKKVTVKEVISTDRPEGLTTFSIRDTRYNWYMCGDVFESEKFALTGAIQAQRSVIAEHEKSVNNACRKLSSEQKKLARLIARRVKC